MVLSGRERLQVREEQFNMLERRLLVLLEPEAKPAGGEAGVAVRLLRATSAVSSSGSAIVTRPISRAVTSASTRLSCSSARLKMVRGWPCEVDAAPPGAETAAQV